MLARREHINPGRTLVAFLRLFPVGMLATLFVFLSTNQSSAQEPEYEEILVSVNIQGMGTIEVPAIINEQTLYLPVVDIFDYLKIKNESSQSSDTISGFFISQDNTYLIDKTNNKIFVKDKEIQLAQGDLVKTETSLYLKMSYFGSLFNLPSVFNFRALLVNMSSVNELPVMRDARLDAIRNNLRRLKGEIIADTTLKRLNPWIHFGMTDWSVIAAQQSDGVRDTRVNLGFGGIVLGGEVNASLNYSTSIPFKEKQQFYWWRHVNNDAKAVKQVTLGKIPTTTVSSIFSPILGVHVTNSPTIAKRAFGSYRLSNITEPGWIVELYVNNVLVDYVKADESGYFSFNVPLVYGNSAVKLRYYGPFGEEHTKEENISIPFNFMTPGKFEYMATAGVVEDDSLSRLARGGVNYGINRFITVGTGVEYLSSVVTSPVMPFVSTSIRLGSGLLIFGEHNYQVRTKAGLFYRTVSNWQFELNYTNYVKGQKAINNNALEERRAVVSVPLRFRRLSIFSMLTFNQTKLPSTLYTTTEWLVSGTYKRFDARLNTIGIYMPETQPLVYTNFAVAIRLPAGFILTPEAQYQYTLNEFLSIKGTVEKRIFRRGYLGLNYEENFKSHFRNMGIQLRYDFDFAQIGFTGRHLNNKFLFLESTRGSVMYDGYTNYAGFNNSTSIGRSGVVLLPFLDMNCNGQRDEGEPKVSGLKFRINAGRVQPEGRDTTIRIHGLEPYNNYFIELNKLSFDNIAWQMQKKTLRVFAEPNMFRLVEVPIAVVGEVTGSVTLQKGATEQGQGQILIAIYKNDSLVAKTLSEPDGYFSYMGLAPGDYIATIDAAQLRKINMIASEPQPFTISVTRDGDVVEGLQFTVRSVFDTIQQEQTSIKALDTITATITKMPKKTKKSNKQKTKTSATTVASQAQNYISFPSPMMAAKRPVASAHKSSTPHTNHPKSPAKSVAPVITKAKKIPIQVDSTPIVGHEPNQQQDSVALSPTPIPADSTKASVLVNSIDSPGLVIQDSVATSSDSLKVDNLPTAKKKSALLRNLRRLFGANKEEQLIQPNDAPQKAQ